MFNDVDDGPSPAAAAADLRGWVTLGKKVETICAHTHDCVKYDLNTCRIHLFAFYLLRWRISGAFVTWYESTWVCAPHTKLWAHSIRLAFASATVMVRWRWLNRFEMEWNGLREKNVHDSKTLLFFRKSSVAFVHTLEVDPPLEREWKTEQIDWRKSFNRANTAVSKNLWCRF